jgi:hypothetical protein
MRSLLILALALSLGSMSGVPAHAQPKTPGLAVVPDEERRSRIVEIFGQVQFLPALRGPRGTADTDYLRQKFIQNARDTAIKANVRERQIDGKSFY